MITARANYVALAPEAMQILMDQERYLRDRFHASEPLGAAIWELIKLRVSQINQCAFCIDLHSKEALAQGETAERIIGLSAWRDMPLYSAVEEAALAWAEHLTDGRTVDDQMYLNMVNTLGERALLDITLAVNAINGWNRIVKTFKPEVGSYKPR
ncbi:carboxymuconolactone decarboxylase family protein [Marinobacter daepoensis]|uniref:carboxymuconolactone decarboxylase family protein n=1 Tax=Marinobacter daepoensis TaxID=262077 RepID=UPI000417B9D0|nr:carboxymuconolactone decarboxylase family protein [Marinobacter daepoensis]